MKGRLVVLGILAFASLSINSWAQQEERHGHEKQHHKQNGEFGKHERKNTNYRSEKLENRVFRITQPDSIQQKKMKPIIEKISKRLIALRTESERKEKNMMDSLQLSLKPILNANQLNRLKGSIEKKNEGKSK